MKKNKSLAIAQQVLIAVLLLVIICVCIFRLTAPILINKALFQPQFPHYHEESPHLQFLPAGNSMGQQIAIRFIPGDPGKPVILFSHGNAEDLASPNVLWNDAIELGYAVLAWDYPGYGLSTGEPDESSILEGAEAVYGFLTQQKGFAPGQIILYGFSLGSAPSTYLAEKYPVKLLIHDGAFTSVIQIAGLNSIPFSGYDPFRNIERMPDIHCPYLSLHGKRDNIVPISHAEKLFHAAPEPKLAIWNQSAGHGNVYGNCKDEFWESFLKITENQKINEKK